MLDSSFTLILYCSPELDLPNAPEVVTALRSHGPTSASLCEESIDVIIILAAEDGSRHRLRNVGACEGSLADFIIHFGSHLSSSPSH